MSAAGLPYDGATVTDHELLQSWRDGDARAGEALFDRHFRSLHGFFRNKVGAACQDLVQRVLLACLERRDTFEGKSGFRTWLFGIARFELLRHYREQGKLAAEGPLPTQSLHDLDPSPSVVIGKAEEERNLSRALRRLPIDMQIALELHYWERLSTGEIAEVLEIPQGTVKSRLRRGRELLEAEVARLSQTPELAESTVGDLDRWVGGIREQLGI